MLLSWVFVGFQGIFVQVEEVIPAIPWNAADCVAAKL